MKFKKVYIEITNSCNFNCSFCFSQTRPHTFLSPERFRFIAEKVKPYTDYVYLHVLGEPFLHPKFKEILSIAFESGFLVNITTNGSLLHKHFDFLLENPVRQINISLHDAEENIPKEEWKSWLKNISVLAKKLSEETFINLRLWNSSHNSSEEFNLRTIQILSEVFNTEIHLKKQQVERNITLGRNVFLQYAPRFEWREFAEKEEKTCYGLKDQFAVLANGDVVPCCIDAEANLLLGNIFSEELDDILNSQRAVRIKKGFEQHKAVESYCKKCGFRV